MELHILAKHIDTAVQIRERIAELRNDTDHWVSKVTSSRGSEHVIMTNLIELGADNEAIAHTLAVIQQAAYNQGQADVRKNILDRLGIE